MNIYTSKISLLDQKALAFLALFMLFSVMLFALPPQALAQNKKQNNSGPLYAAFVMDADTGLILHQENASKRAYPASLTKMMTLLMVFDALDRGTLKLDDRIRFSEYAASMQPSKIGLKPGQSIRVEDAIYILVTRSANDLAVAVAEKLGGSESNFALMMTQRAHALGMRDTQFRNASGLPDTRQYTTARDMARLSLVLIRDYKRHYHYFSTKNYNYQGTAYRNHNRLMETYKGMDGLKTGFINASGFNLAASAVRGNRRLIAVVFGGRTAQSRNERMARLLDDGFAKIGAFNVAGIKNVPIPQQKPIFVAGLGQVYATPPAPMEAKKANTHDDMSQDSRAPRWALLDTSNENSVLSRMIGQGDFDTQARARIETGVIAMAAVTREALPPQFFESSANYAAGAEPQSGEPQMRLAAYAEPPPPPPKLEHKLVNPSRYTPNQGNEWAIQIGAFSTRERTNAAINDSLKRLPASLRGVNPVVAPLQTSNGWVFRGRLTGYTREAALKACDMLTDCMPIAPHGQQ